MNEKRCPYCGTTVKSGADFCLACGAQLTKAGEIRKSPIKDRSSIFLMALSAVALIGLAYFMFVSKSEKAAAEFKHPEIPGMSQDITAMSGPMTDLPKDYGKLVELGNRYMDKGMFEMAIECYNKAISIDSTDPNVITDLGACYHALGDADQALNIFGRAIALDPKHATAYFNMGIVYHDLNNIEKMKASWNKVIEYHPKEPLADSVRKYLQQLGP